MKKGKHPRLHGNILNIALLVLVAGVLAFAIFLVRAKLLENAQNLGMALVHSYALEEEMNIDSLEKHLTLAGRFVEEILDEGGSSADIQDWLAGYFAKCTGVIGEGVVDFYAVVDGQIVAANPWEGYEGYQYELTNWYQDAIEARGEVVQGEVYRDTITGQKIFTISMALSQQGSVLAMDVYVQNEALHNTVQTLPTDCSYFLCDKDGDLLYARTKWAKSDEVLQGYTDYVMAGIADGSLLAYDAFVTDAEGTVRGVYYQTMDNGWTVIMTIPAKSILMGEQSTVIYIMAAVALALFLVLAFMTIQDAVRGRAMKKVDDTAHMLGDSFYAIYRVNPGAGTYEAIKTYWDVKGKLPEKGAYTQLLDTMRTLVKPTTYTAFEAGFSLENIRQRMDQGVEDYGGDYERRFGDTYRWVNVRTLYNRELAPDEVILCFRDVDEEKRRELQNTMILQNALDAAQKSTRAKSEFFSSMSHDMRTPLNAILGCCELAQRCQAQGEQERVEGYLKKISFAGGQMLGLVNDILELSRLEAGKNYLEEKEMDLEQLLRATAGLFQDRAQEEGKHLEVSIDFRAPAVIGDEKKLGQIVNNLLSNAIKYTSPGDTIRLEARQFEFKANSKFQIVVEDTGTGMSPAFLEHLFDPYARETAFTAHSTVGTGLGMSIVKSLVQQMSGEIGVESTLGEGSRFTVTIPLKTVQAQQQAGRTSQEQPPEVPFDWAGRTILVAEDNELNREIVTEILEQLGARVICAVNGQEAVHSFLAQPPYHVDAILMDMQMPVMDGCQAASAIRQLHREDAASVPIIAVTANVFAEDIARTTKAGMNDHISKPIDTGVLARTLQKLLGEDGKQGR